MSSRGERARFACGRRGISLLEAVAAVAIVGMTAVGSLSAAASELRTAERARRALEAEALATARLDFMNLLYDADLQALPDSVAKGTFAKPLDEYAWTATSAAYSDQAGVYDVRVTIKWPEGSYTEKTYLYRRPAVVTRR
jgi:type II secretory pathway pseudopilin PulG